MKKLYTLTKQATAAVAISFTLFTMPAFGQSLCGPVVEDFEETSGSTVGFTGDFIIGASGGDEYLEKRGAIGSAVYVITTPTFTLPAGSNSIGYGFILDGSNRVARVEASITYRSTLNGQITTFFLAQFVPFYNQNSTDADICRAIATTDLPGFPAGGSYRFQFEITPVTGNGDGNSTVTFDDFRTNGTLAQAPLPVNFIDFEAKKISGGVQLTWKVAGEENVNRYEVERSTDGRNFTSVGSVATTKRDVYTYFDNRSSTTVYYRIKNVDNDGKFKYSTIARLVNGKSEIVLKAFPQPVANQLTVQHPVVKGNTILTLSAADGRIVRTLKASSGSMQTFVDMSTLQKGMYLIRFDGGDGNVETMKVLKQ
jgi:hypothetical protein